MKKAIFTSVIMVLVQIGFAQVPAAFNYQATARTSSGELLAEKALTIRIGILQDNALIWQEDHNVVTNHFGHFSMKIGGNEALNGTGSAGSFGNIDWGTGSHIINLQVDDGNGFTDMGGNELLSVPYALFAANSSFQSPWIVEGNTVSLADKRLNLAIGTNKTPGKFVIAGEEMPDDVPLFEVRNFKGQSVLSGFNNGAFINVEPTETKGLKGGFAVGGYSKAKAEPIQEYFRVTSDSIRVTINDALRGKGLKGGFAVGGYNSGKADSRPYFYVERGVTIIDGNLQLSGTIGEISDAGLKSNIMELDQVLDKLKQLRGVYFDWNEQARESFLLTESRQVGVIAQEVESVYPELIMINDKGYKMVDYSKLTPVLVQAIREQQEQIEKLQEKDQKISELEERIIQLEKHLNK